ncbi:MAG: MFS transporter, partial [Muribaculaceae bacterium]|nr:MFS transporter [Muribaculaceae bacterium]
MENTNTSASLKSTQGSLSMSGTGLPSGGYYAFLILYLVLLSAFGSFVNDMYLPTLPEMVRSFHTSRSTVQLGLTFGMIGLGFGELILGPLSDRFGRKPILIGSLIVFAIGAICSVWS